MFKSLSGLASVYLHELFSKRDTASDLRGSFRKLNLPKPRTDYLKRSFGYSGALLRNYLPKSIRAIISIGQFKMEINRVLETFDSHSAICHMLLRMIGQIVVDTLICLIILSNIWQSAVSP